MTYAQQKAYMRTFVKNQSSTIYTIGWTMKHVKSFSDDQLKTDFDKIRAAVAELKSLNIKRFLKRPGADLEQASSKKSKSTEATKSDVLADSPQPSKVGTRRKQFGRKGVHPSHSTIPIEDEDPEAEYKMCIKYASNADSAPDDDTPVNLHAVVDWELLPTGLGWVNVIYRKDNSRKFFSRLREILHLVTRTDLMIIYGRVMTFYQDKKATGVGLVLWGDLKVLIVSPEVNDGSDVWKNQHTWVIQSWKLYSYTGIHVLETVSGLVVHMFVDKKYPLSVNLIERMLDHQLEICRDTVGNELTTAVQLIAFLKKQISNSRRPKLVVNGFCLLEILVFGISSFASGNSFWHAAWFYCSVTKTGWVSLAISWIESGHLHIFGCTCYLTRDGENLDKMKEKGDPYILESDYDNSDPVPQLQNVSPSANTSVPSQQELELLFGPLYDEFFNTGTSSVNKSSSPANNSAQQDTTPTMNIYSSTKPSTPTNVNAKENNDNQVEDAQVQQDEFTNPFYTLIVTTSRYVVPTGRVKVSASRYVVPTGRVKVPAGRYVVPTGKDNVIVSTGRTKVIPIGRTILVLWK
ncbi:hypothetical protein Tco_0847879, partial [Tanacetum coccineum]